MPTFRIIRRMTRQHRYRSASDAYCDDFVCAPSSAYLKGLRLRVLRGGDDVGELFRANVNHDEFSGRIPVAPWQIASPLQAWVIDAYGNRSNVAAVTWPIADADQHRQLQALSPPAVAITAPLNNATYTAPLTTTLKATATPSTGATISKVDFYAGPTLLGTVTVSPYNLTWAGVQVGTYALTAKVTDSLNATATSAVVNVIVNAGATRQAARCVFDSMTPGRPLVSLPMLPASTTGRLAERSPRLLPPRAQQSPTPARPRALLAARSMSRDLAFRRRQRPRRRLRSG